MADTKKETQETVKMLAKEAFADHQLSYDAETRTWRCAKPDSGFYHFRLAELPGLVVIWGDIGTMTIDGHHYDLAWAEGSLNSPDYFLSKTSTKRDYFYRDDFKRNLRDQIKDREAELEDGMGSEERLKAAIDKAYKDYQEAGYYDYDLAAYHAYCMNNPGTEMHRSVFGYDSQGYWMIEALRTFFRLKKEMTDEKPCVENVA